MLPPLASKEQLIARLGVTPAGADLGRAEACLEDASAAVRGAAEQDYVTDENELDEAAVPAVIQSITLACALRAFRNPDGAQRAQVGDTSISYRSESGGDAVFLTAAERRAVRRAAGISGVQSVQLESPFAGALDPHYVPVLPGVGADLFPIGPFPWETA